MDKHPESNEAPEEPSTTENTPPAEPDLERREFLSKATSIVAGGIMVAIPAGAGVGTLLSPLAQKKTAGVKQRLANVDELPADGTPKRFDIVTERNDAWTKYPAKAIGSVWLRKQPDGTVLAFNTSCPHLGCSVDYNAGDMQFLCPCHASLFALDGATIGKSVSPRGMDELEIDQEKLAAGEVWVTFVNFKSGTADKQPA
jgi:Rieske Fe-S protein